VRLPTKRAITGSQTTQVQQGASARTDEKWRHETLEAELGVVGYYDLRGILERPKETYSFSDHWKTIIGGELHRGDDRSSLLLRSELSRIRRSPLPL
jgi:hypothetical protein